MAFIAIWHIYYILKMVSNIPNQNDDENDAHHF